MDYIHLNIVIHAIYKKYNLVLAFSWIIDINNIDIIGE